MRPLLTYAPRITRVETTQPAVTDGRLLTAAAVLISAGLLLVALRISPTTNGASVGVALILLVFCARQDLATLRVPNPLTYGGLALVLGATLVLPGASFLSSLAGAALGGSFLLILSVSSRGKLGLGDAKLAAFGGALVGLRYVIPALFFGSLAAALVILLLLLLRRISRDQPLPYVPFLALGFILTGLTTGTTLNL